MMDDDVIEVLWLAYHNAVRRHVEADDSGHMETEAEYRKRAEKAGIVAVANLVGLAYRRAA